MRVAAPAITRQLIWPHQPPGNWMCSLSSLSGMLAIFALAAVTLADTDPVLTTSSQEPSTNAATVSTKPSPIDKARLRPSWTVGAYGGVAYTHPTEVRITKPDKSEVTARNFDWIGRPFKAPIYYGIRTQRWSRAGTTGTMLDFTHAKAIANRDSDADFTGSHNAKPLPSKAKIGDVFRHLEFSHGHNMVTLNGLLRAGTIFGRIRPYLGGGGGVSLPHTEFGFKNDNARTYEYQYAGLAGQALAGLEIDLGRTSVFIEYKFTYAPYDVPLSHEPRGWLLVTDLWRQISAWWRGENPPGGRLTVNLSSHHAIAGVLIKTTRPAPTGR